MPALLSFTRATNLIFPQRCLVCARRIHGTRLCSFCAPEARLKNAAARCICCFTPDSSLDASRICETCRFFPLVFRKARYLWEYEGAARALINAMKYKPSPELARTCAGLLVSHMDDFFPYPDWDLIVPVPASHESFCRRTFNQCAILAAAIAAAQNQTACITSFKPLALTHLGSTAPQASLPHERRIGNVRRSFRADQRDVAGKRVLLVDDVITSGATSTAAALALYAAGAVSVDLAALARAPAWSASRAEVHRRMPSAFSR